MTKKTIDVKRNAEGDIDITIKETSGHGLSMLVKVTEITIDWESLEVLTNLIQAQKDFQTKAKVKKTKVTKTETIVDKEGK